jgi:hypothetical protein
MSHDPKRRELIVTEHAAQRYAQRCARRGAQHAAQGGACSGGQRVADTAEIIADFAAARLVPRRERAQLYVRQPRAIVKYQQAGATYFHNQRTGSVFVCEALGPRAFRLVTCFRFGLE